MEPYGTIIEAALHDFAGLKFVIEHDSDHQTTLSNPLFSLTIATERNYQPSILSHLSCNGRKFETGLSARILSRQKFDIDMDELDEIKGKYHLDIGGGNEAARSIGMHLYVEVAMRQIFSFISKFNRCMTPENEAFYTEYLSRERALINQLGL